MPASEPRDEATLLGPGTLIVTCYGPRSGTSMTELHLRLYHALSGDTANRKAPSEWRDETGSARLRWYLLDSPVAHDTVVLQVGLNADGAVVDAWQTMWERVQSSLATSALEGAWGYSTVFQATVPSGTVLTRINPSLRFDVGQHRMAQSRDALASAVLGGGKLFLLAVPRVEGPFSNLTVYLAICPADAERAFMTEVLWGRAASILLPDLIAHKGYYIRAEHQRKRADDVGDPDEWYRSSTRDLRDTTDRLLSELGRRTADSAELDALATSFGTVAEVTGTLKRLHVSALQQLHNFDRERSRLGANDILEYHHLHLETAAYELELKIALGSDAMQAAESGISLAQIRVNEDQISRQEDTQRQQQWTQMLLATAAAVFAVPTLIDRPAVKELLNFFGVNEPAFGIVFGLQIVIVTLIAILAGVSAHRLGAWWSNRSRPSS